MYNNKCLKQHQNTFWPVHDIENCELSMMMMGMVMAPPTAEAAAVVTAATAAAMHKPGL